MHTRVKVNKATGPDDIPAWVIRNNADVLAAPLMAIFNSSLREGILPPQWKSAYVVGYLCPKYTHQFQYRRILDLFR